MISHPWVGGYTLKIGYHLSKVGLVLGKNRRWVGRQKPAQKIGYHLWMAPNYPLQIIPNSLDIHAQDHKTLTGPALMRGIRNIWNNRLFSFLVDGRP